MSSLRIDTRRCLQENTRGILLMHVYIICAQNSAFQTTINQTRLIMTIIKIPRLSQDVAAVGVCSRAANGHNQSCCWMDQNGLINYGH